VNCPIVQTIEREFYVRDVGGTLKLKTFQKRILNYCFTPDKDGHLPFQTIVISMIKKSGKTALAAAITYAFARVYGGEMYSIANDLEGAKNRMFDRVTQSLAYMREENKELFSEVMPDNKQRKERIALSGTIEFAENKQLNTAPHILKYIASDYAGEAGAMNSLVVFDEIWGVSSERGRRLWHELPPLPPVPALHTSIRLVTTYAGFYGESELLWDIYNSTVKPDPHTEEPQGNRVPGLEDLPVFVSDSGDMVVYWDHEPRMPWHTPEYLESQKNDPTMRPAEYKRLWENRWSTGSEAFIDMDVVHRAIADGEELGLYNRLASF